MSAAWKVDDFNSDLHRAKDLVAIICEIRFQLERGEDDPRLDNLLWIAREMLDGLCDHHDRKGGARNG